MAGYARPAPARAGDACGSEACARESQETAAPADPGAPPGARTALRARGGRARRARRRGWDGSENDDAARHERGQQTQETERSKRRSLAAEIERVGRAARPRIPRHKAETSGSIVADRQRPNGKSTTAMTERKTGPGAGRGWRAGHRGTDGVAPTPGEVKSSFGSPAAGSHARSFKALGRRQSALSSFTARSAPASALGGKQRATMAPLGLPDLVRNGDEISADAGYRSLRESGRRPAIGDFRDSRWPGVRTCFQLPAVLTTRANRASPSEVPGSAARDNQQARTLSLQNAFSTTGSRDRPGPRSQPLRVDGRFGRHQRRARSPVRPHRGMGT